jgi:hypothetical protein
MKFLGRGFGTGQARDLIEQVVKLIQRDVTWPNRRR